jgi:hypothetical protein
VDNDARVRTSREPICGDTVTKLWETFFVSDQTSSRHKGRPEVSEQGEEAPAESFATAKLRADVARQQMRLAKDQLKRARKRFKEARREARQARKLAEAARKVWTKARRSAVASGDGEMVVAKVASEAETKRSRRDRGDRNASRGSPRRKRARRRS